MTRSTTGAEVMTFDPLDLYGRASVWTLSKVRGRCRQVGRFDTMRRVGRARFMNHMLETQRYFVGSAQGDDVSPPSPLPPELLGDDPVADFARPAPKP